MSTEFKQEERYVVFKLSDVEEHFTPGERQQLARLVEVQRVGREEAGKAPLECVVVEADWPEYEPTWKAIQARMTGAQPVPSVPEGWKLVPTAESRHPGIPKMLNALHTVDNTPGASEWESYAAFLAAAPEAKP
jgi:hypothetical protein